MAEKLDDRRWLTEHRYRAVLQVLDGGVPVTQAAAQYGTSRQSLYNWLHRYEADGLDGLSDRSRRPHSSPTRLAAELEAAICELRQSFPRWGARRISHELAARGMAAPGRTTVHRVLARNGLVTPQEQQQARKYKRWAREAPMQLWQIDIMGGVFLAGGRECKLVTGIDDHSRYVVIAQVVTQPSGRAVCQALTDALARHGVPSEVLTDNGKQFTGRYTKPVPAEVLFERICRENGITARLTKPRNPTTTGKIERFHQTLRRELLDHTGPFADQATAQSAIDAWVQAYNHSRPHQALNMATPVSAFRPAPAAHTTPAAAPASVLPPRLPAELASPPPAAALSEHDVHAVEMQMLVPPGGRLCLPGNLQVKLGQAYAGRTVNVWADDRSIHVSLDGQLVRTRTSRLSPADLLNLHLKGARLAGPPPGPAAAPSHLPLAAAAAAVVEVDRSVNSNARVELGGHRVTLASHLIGQRVTLRLDGHLMHVIAAGCLVQTLPAPIPTNRRTRLAGARIAEQPLPPPPAQPPRAQRRVPVNGEIMVARQRLHVGATHAGKTVTVVIEDTHFRVLHNDIELRAFSRTSREPVTRFKAFARRPRT